MKPRLLLALPLILLSVLLLIGCLNSVSRPIPSPSPPPVPAFEDAFLTHTEVRTECGGVPVLCRIPFLNRFFMNTAIGRDSFFIWDAPCPYSPDAGPLAAVVSEDGTWLLLGRDKYGIVSIFNLRDPSVPGSTFRLARGNEDAQVAWLAMLPDNSAFLVYQIGNDLETMELFNRETAPIPQRAFPIEPGFQSAALSPDGELLYCVGQTSLEAWNVQTGEKISSVPLHTQEGITELRCSSNAPWLFLATRTGNVRIFDLNTLTETVSLPAGNEAVLIDISPDGKTLMVTGSEKNCKIQFYEIGTWDLLREIMPNYPHEYEFQNLRFSRNGDRLIGRGAVRTVTPPLTTFETLLAEYDLNEPNEDWKRLEYATLPLHPEGKFLLVGSNRSGKFLSPYSEQIAVFSK